jgi:hypothetical protein
MEFNGLPVTRSKDDSTIFIPLPPEAWRLIDGSCLCDSCRIPDASTSRGYRSGTAFWDTLAIRTKAEGTDTTWAVHMPEIHPKDIREAKLKEAMAQK